MNPIKVAFLIVPLAWAGLATGQDEHDHSSKSIRKPRVFLDKSPRIVAYQLKRLSDAQLLLVDRAPDDAKYAPVYQAVLSRPKIDTKTKSTAIEELARLNGNSIAAEISDLVGQWRESDVEAAKDLLTMLTTRPTEELQELVDVESSGSDWRQIAQAIAIAATNSENTSGLSMAIRLRAVGYLSDRETLGRQIALVSDALVNSTDDEIKRQAIRVAPKLDDFAAGLSAKLAGLFERETLRDEVVRSLLKMSPGNLTDSDRQELANRLVEVAEATPVAERSGEPFLRLVELAEPVMKTLGRTTARDLRKRLSAISIRVVRIGTVEEEMRYDRPFFTVQAGSDVQVILDNHDLMPHNLVITIPGQLKKVAADGLSTGPTGGKDGLAYVPDTDDVLFATSMIAAGQSERLTFKAPRDPGEYPYVCTFPQHWSRMYGVMLVVPDLEAWLADPVPPADPIGSNRSFVASWTVEDFKGDFPSGLRGRNPEIGKKLFVEASCQTCHKIQGDGGAVGPELTDVYAKWKGDHDLILREILDPSACIDEKYAMHTILTVDGQTISGVINSETDDEVSIVDDPESGKATIVLVDDIEDQVKSPNSMMPKGLLNQYTKDEILELIAYLEWSGGGGETPAK